MIGIASRVKNGSITVIPMVLIILLLICGLEYVSWHTPEMTRWKAKMLAEEPSEKNPAQLLHIAPDKIGDRESSPYWSFVTTDPQKLVPHFKAPNWEGHLDARWAKRITLAERKLALRLLFQKWTEFCRLNNLFSWLAHGTLVGWSWNHKNLPWDNDLDLQTTYQHLITEMVKYNTTIFDKRYWFETNRLVNLKIRFTQRSNFIDARFIDMQNGLYIDLTALARDSTMGNRLQCKSPHHYAHSDIFPLIQTTFEGVPAWRPHRTMEVLLKEYKSVDRETFFTSGRVLGRPWVFNFEANEWQNLTEQACC